MIIGFTGTRQGISKHCLDCFRPLSRLDVKRCRSCAGKKHWEDPGERERASKIGKRYFEDPENRRKRGLAIKNSPIFQKVMKSKEFSEIQKKIQNRPEVLVKLREAKCGDRNPMRRPEVSSKCSGPNHYNWHGGYSIEPYGPEFNNQLKEQIRDRDDHLCQFPGCYVSENGCQHDIHHIDYDKKNNVQKNLITLCHECHTKTTNGDREHWTELFKELQQVRGLGKL